MMNRPIILGLLLATSQAANIHTDVTRHSQLTAETGKPAVILQERHNFPPKLKPLKNGDVVTKYSNLMTDEMCRPQENGYFGSTAGAPLVLEYGFELETTIFSNTDRILHAINQYIEMQVLSRTFSSMCGLQRRLTETQAVVEATSDLAQRKLGLFEGTISHGNVNEKITGFRFSEGRQEPSLFCDPMNHEQNLCGYYTSQIRVFGRGLNAATSESILESVRAALPLSLEMGAKYGAVRIELAEHLTRQVAGPYPMSSTSRSGPSVGAMMGLFVSIVVLLMCLYYLLVFWRADQKSVREPERLNGKLHEYHGGRSLASTAHASTASQPSVHSADERRRQNQRLFVEFGPSFDPDRDRVVQEQEEESSCLPDYVFQDPIYQNYLYRQDDGENIQII